MALPPEILDEPRRKARLPREFSEKQTAGRSRTGSDKESSKSSGAKCKGFILLWKHYPPCQAARDNLHLAKRQEGTINKKQLTK
jgi:hypothetical protein